MSESWDLTGYPLEVQCAYERLMALGPHVEVLHPGPYPSQTAEAVYSGLHRYLTELPRFFLAFVDNAERHFDQSVERKGKARGGLNGLLKFKLFLDKQLEFHEAQELLWNSTGSLGDTQVPPSAEDAQVVKTVPVEGGDVAMEVKEEIGLRDRGRRSPQNMPEPSRSRAAHGTPNSSRSVRTVHSPSTGSFLNKLRSIPPPYPLRTSAILSARTSSSTSIDSRHSLSTAVSTEADLVETPPTSLDEVAPNPFAPVQLGHFLDDTMGIPSRAIAHQQMPIPAVPADQRIIKVTQNSYEAMINKLDIHFDILWRFERALAAHPLISWNNVQLADLDRLQGISVDVVPRLDQLIRDINARSGGIGSTTAAEKAVWSQTAAERHARLLHETDLEEVSLRRQDLQGLGASPHADMSYGGKIVYSIVVRPKADLPKRDFRRVKSAPIPATGPAAPQDQVSEHYRLELQAPELSGKSFRLARRYGSRRVVIFRLHGDIKDKSRAFEFFRGRIFVILGRPYRALWAPPDSDNIPAIETNDELHTLPTVRNEEKMPSYLELLARFNSLEAKPGQPMAKWAARKQLLFSDSVPAARVHPSAIDYIDDLVSLHTQNGNTSTEQILTDGCGLMSESLACQVFSYPALPFESGRPCVLQVRIGGAKGLLALMSPEQQAMYPAKDILIRSSMLKAIPAPQFADDPSHFIVDVVRSEVLRLGTYLSPEPIIVMVDRGVPVETIIAMGMQSLDELRVAFSPKPAAGETTEDVLQRLHAACYRQGGVGTERKKRLLAAAGGSAKVAGLERKGSTSEISDLDIGCDGVELLSSAERYEVDPTSGQPGSIAEALMEAIAGGFSPLQSYYTCNKLHHTMRQLLDSMTRKLKFRVESSLSAFIVPDSLGVLAPDEIFIRFSKDFPLDPVTKCPLTHLTGDVLVFRSPCKLPTDVRKFRAVYRPELAHLTDCVVMSAHSSCVRSPASFLGGGDYDGDIVQVFWDPLLVEPFQNAPDHLADTPADFEDQYFEKEKLSGEAFLRTMEGQNTEVVIASLQHFLLGALLDEKHTGVYSKLHANAVYKLGLGHPQTMDLARIFCLVLDARKSGLRLRDDVRRQHMREHDGYLSWLASRNGEENINQRDVVRPKQLGRFIMDVLRHHADQKATEIMGDFLSEIPDERCSSADYLAISRPWTAMEDVAKGLLHGAVHVDLAKIRAHVDVCYKMANDIRCSRVDRYQSIGKLYDDLLFARHSPPDSPMDNGTPSTHQALRYRRGSPVKKNKAEADENSIIMVTQMRRLAEVWRDRLKPEDVPTCCWGSETQLARLKAGFGATLARPRTRQKFTFDMDFHTTRILKAESMGGKLGVIPAIYESLKPGWKGDLGE